MKKIMWIASLLLSAVVLVSCEKDGGDDTSMDAGFYVMADKNVIQSNGEDFATFTALLDGKDVTAETVFYLKEGKDMRPVNGNKLKVSSAGTYDVIGSYGTFYTEDPVSISAIDMPVPAAAEDTDPSKTSFVHRSFLNQYTGTGCGYCPGMIRALRAAFEDEQTAEMAVLAAVHSFGAGDPAYISGPRSNSYPYLHIDMVSGFTYDMDPFGEGKVLKTALQERTSSPAKVGISANPVFKDDVLVVTVEVKAAAAGEYNVGVWFMQDNVYGQQKDQIGIVAGDKSFEYHDNCVRSADSRYLNSYAGYPLGEIKAGKTAKRTFVLNIDKTDWKLKDMNDIHFAAFVTAKTGKAYEVVNVIDCPYNEPSPYEYK